MRLWLGAIALLIVASSASAFEFRGNEYDLFLGDVNGDGIDDIYLKPKDIFVLLHGDVAVPIFAPSNLEIFYIESVAAAEPYYLGPSIVPGPLSLGGLVKANDRASSVYIGGGKPTALRISVGGNLIESVVVTNSPLSSPEIASTSLQPSVVSAPAPSATMDRSRILNGDFSTDKAGNARYNIPIVTAPGSAGLVPEISLSYSSGAGNGVVGFGWSLNSGGGITRCRKTYGADRAAEPISFSSNDRFCLNGQRLLLVSGEYGAPGSTYKTEIDSFARITAEGGSEGHPSYFTVEYKNGIVDTFGNTSDSANSRHLLAQSDSKSVFTWSLGKREDSAGNQILYKYISDGSGHRIDKVEFAFGHAATPGAYVKFIYEDRDDPIRGFIAGKSTVLGVRLSKVQSYNGSTQIREYRVNYDQGSAHTEEDQLSRVSSVQECVDALCSQATNFEWSLPEVAFSSLSSEFSLDGGVSDLRFGDVNGDGLQDLIWYEWAGLKNLDNELKARSWRYATGFVQSDGRFAFQRGKFDDGSFVSKRQSEKRYLQVIDLNNDGRSDVITSGMDGTLRTHYPSAHYSTFDGTKWIVAQNPVSTISGDQKIRYFVDVNGDGLLDSLAWPTDVRPWDAYSVDLASVAYLKPKPSAPSTSSSYYEFDIHPLKQIFSGSVNASSTWVDSHFSERHLAPIANLLPLMGDFNGSGRMDIMASTYWRLSQCTDDGNEEGCREAVTLPYLYTLEGGDNERLNLRYFGYENVSLSSSVGRTLIADLNGDGLSDQILGGTATNLTFMLSNGRSLQSGIVTEIPPNSFAAHNEAITDVALADINADGYPDAVWHAPKDPGAPVGSGQGSVWVNYWNPKLNTFDSDSKLLIDNIPFEVRENYADPYIWNRGYSRYKTSAINMMDLNNDGVFDLVVTPTTTSGSVRVYLGAGAEKPKNKIISVVKRNYDRVDITYGKLNKTNHYARGDVINATAPRHCAEVADSQGLYSVPVCWDVTAGKSNTADFYQSLNEPWKSLTIDQQSLKSKDPTFTKVGPQFVVTQVARSAPLANQPDAMRRTAYFYENLRSQASGRGFLGFELVSEVDLETGLRTSTRYRQDWPFIGRPALTQIFTREGHQLYSEESTWGLVKCYTGRQPDLSCVESLGDNLNAYGSAALGPLQVARFKSSERKWALHKNGSAQGILLREKLSTFEYDDKGNAVLEETNISGSKGDGLYKLVRHDYEYHGSTWSMQLGRQSRMEVTVDNEEYLPITRVSTFDYYQDGAAKGLLQTETVEPGSNLELSTTHFYSGGNKVKSIESAEGQVRVAEVEYDSRGRYVDKVYQQYSDGNNADSSIRRLSHQVIARDQYGAPVEQHSYVSPTTFITTKSATTPFGIPYFSSDGTGGYKIMNSGAGASTAGVCPSTTAVWTHIQQAGGGESIECRDSLSRIFRVGTLGFDGSDWSLVDTEHDKFGRAVRISAPYKLKPEHWTSFEYDVEGRVIKSLEPHEGSFVTTSTEYDGYQKRILNPVGHLRIEHSDALGQVVEVTDPGEGKTIFKYDARGNLREMLDPAGNVTEMHYDARDQKTFMADPDKGSWHYRYNKFGELICQQDAKKQVVVTRFDIRGRPFSRTDYKAGGSCDAPSGAVEGFTRWVYDVAENGLGKVAKTYVSASAGGSIDYQKSFTYDGFGRKTTATTAVTGHNSQMEKHYEKFTYDQFGRILQIFDAARRDATFDSNGIQNVYNDQGYLVEVVEAIPKNGNHYSYYSIQKMDARGNVTNATYGNGVKQVSEYYRESGLAKTIAAFSPIVTDSLQNIELDWDAVGNLESREETGGGTWIDMHLRKRHIFESFSYDALNRLDGWNTSGDIRESASIIYDGIDNVRQKTGEGEYFYGRECSHTSAGPHAVCRINGGGAQRLLYYDANGNVTSDSSGRTIKYTVFDKPSSISNGVHTTDFKYGPDRARYKRVDKAGSSTTTTLYLGSVEKIHYSDGSVAWKRTLAGVAIFSEKFTAAGVRQGAELNYLHYDHLGSLSLITTDSGLAKSDHYFDPWGNARQASEPLGSWQQERPYLKANKPITGRGFTGHEMLDEVGIIHMNGRIYDAALGRFLQADPIVQDPLRVQSLNRYSYVWNNPLNATDPSGYFSSTIESKKTEEIQEDRDDPIEVEVIGEREKPERQPPMMMTFFKDSADTSGNAYTFVALQDTYGNVGLFSYDVVTNALNENADPGQSFVDKLVAMSPETVILASAQESSAGKEAIGRNFGSRNSAQKGGLYGNGAAQMTHEMAELIWPGYDFGTCISQGCGGATWAIATVGLIPGGKGVAVGLKTVLKSAGASKKGSTVLGHALSKHAGRNPDVWGKMTGSMSTWHDQGMTHLREIIRGPGGFKEVMSNGRTFLEKRLEDGRGIRLNMDNTFKTFLD